MEERNWCELCELKTILRTYQDSDPRWIIIDCMRCLLPMAVWRGIPRHTMQIEDEDAKDMEKALRDVARAQFGNDYYIDKEQNQIFDHLHWHARPSGWIPFALRDKKENDPEVLEWQKREL